MSKYNTTYFILLRVQKNILYFQDADKYSSQNITKLEYKIQANDILSITITSLIPETAEPYNSIAGNTGSSNNVNIESMKLRGYLVSNIGNIEMPVLGTVNEKYVPTTAVVVKSVIAPFLLAPVVGVVVVRLVN